MVVSVGIARELTLTWLLDSAILYQYRNEGSGWREGQTATEEV